ncbi:MAG: response regulator transcription factor [Clostridiales bacterium]|nr:response regulator transcription factor [Clostridiales bacterium]
MYRILIAEDDDTLRNILEMFFSKNGFETDAVSNGIDACSYADKNRYDIVILDIMMPGKDGREVCKFIRGKYDVPVIFLTALGGEDDIVKGYEVGADEYISKPFSSKVLLAKVNALISRYHGLLVKDGRITVDEITIEPARRYVAVEGKACELAPKEYELLMYFLDNQGMVLTRNQILDKVWGMDYEGYDRTVDTHIKMLRKALGKAGYHVETVIKSGYVWKNRN